MRKKKKPSRAPTEHEEQVAIFRWAEENKSQYPELKWLYSTLNGVRLPIGAARKAKSAGMKRGVPDIDLPARAGPYSGLRIELKRRYGKPSVEQARFLRFLRSEGYRAVYRRGAASAINEIETYLKLRRRND